MNNSPISNLLAGDPIFLVGLCVILACLLLGFAIGRLSIKMKTSKQIKDAFEEGKQNSIEEMEIEKAEISSELETELLKVRESIIQSAKAYENTVKIVQEKLNPKGIAESPALNGNSEAQLALDFDGENKTPEQEPTLEDTSEEEETSTSEEDSDEVETEETLESEKEESSEVKLANS